MPCATESREPFFQQQKQRPLPFGQVLTWPLGHLHEQVSNARGHGANVMMKVVAIANTFGHDWSQTAAARLFLLTV